MIFKHFFSVYHLTNFLHENLFIIYQLNNAKILTQKLESSSFAATIQFHISEISSTGKKYFSLSLKGVQVKNDCFPFLDEAFTSTFGVR